MPTVIVYTENWFRLPIIPGANGNVDQAYSEIPFNELAWPTADVYRGSFLFSSLPQDVPNLMPIKCRRTPSHGTLHGK